MITTFSYTVSKPTASKISHRAVVTALLLLLSSIPVFSQGESGNSSVDSSRAKSDPLDGTVQVRSGRVQTNTSFEVAPPAPPSLKTMGGSGLGGGMAPGFASPLTMTRVLGATIGGAKDIGYARRLIEQGHVPNFIDFSPEGLYSEHDIPTPSGECNAKLCLSLGYGFAPAADDRTNALFLQLGMNSNIKADEFRRQNLQLAVVIDRSGSMEGESMEATKKALHKLVENLNSSDELTIIQFDDKAHVILPATPGERQNSSEQTEVSSHCVTTPLRK